MAICTPIGHGFGSGLVRVWFGFGSGLVRVWFGFGSGLVRVWFGFGSGSVRFGFGSGSVRVRFGFGSGSVRVRFGFGSGSVRVRFGFGSGSVRVRFRFHGRGEYKSPREFLRGFLIKECHAWHQKGHLAGHIRVPDLFTALSRKQTVPAISVGTVPTRDAVRVETQPAGNGLYLLGHNAEDGTGLVRAVRCVWSWQTQMWIQVIYGATLGLEIEECKVSEYDAALQGAAYHQA